MTSHGLKFGVSYRLICYWTIKENGQNRSMHVESDIEVVCNKPFIYTIIPRKMKRVIDVCTF